ncbi:MAG: hypothetical protein PWR01_4036 [Clostridiales bacterium]|nr:hypothetical protein [Clostridiales bacterium]MDN5282963.1 hypothetical protein [Candidatus Ozemobacter sp.]
MKFYLKFVLLSVFILCCFVRPGFTCDLNLVEILAKQEQSDKQLMIIIGQIASGTKNLNERLSEFLQKHQKYHFPPKNINGQFVNTSIDKNSDEASAFVKEFSDCLVGLNELADSLKSEQEDLPDWVKEDKQWLSKCDALKIHLKTLALKAETREFLSMHETIAIVYNQVLGLLEGAQTEQKNKSLLAISQNISLLIHGLELNKLSEIEQAGKNLNYQLELFYASLPEEQKPLLDELRESVKDLEKVLSKEQFNQIIEIAGKINQQFSQLTEKLSDKF